MKIKEKILLLRKQKGMSLEGLARKLKVTRQAVHKWETGESQPELEKIILLANIFKITSDELLNDSVELNFNNEETAEATVTEYSEDNKSIEEQNQLKPTDKETNKESDDKFDVKKAYSKRTTLLVIVISFIIALAIAITIVLCLNNDNSGTDTDTDIASNIDTSSDKDTETDNNTDTNTETGTDSNIDSSSDLNTDSSTDTSIDAGISTNEAGLSFQIIEGKNEYQLVSVENKQQKRVNIPSSYKGLPVTRINSYSCYDCDSITEISIPASIKYIDSMAFIGVGGNPSIDHNAYNPSLKIYYEGTLEQWCEIIFGHSAFSGNTTALYIDNNQILNLVIPDTITDIKANTFSFFHFESIVISKNVKTIGYRAFYFAETRSIEFTEGLETIGEGAFECFDGDYSSYGFALPSTLKRIEKHAFSSSELTMVEIPDSVEYIGERAFYQCKDIFMLTIGSGVSYIGIKAFYDTGISIIYIEGESKWKMINKEGDIVEKIDAKEFEMNAKKYLINKSDQYYFER